MFIAASVFFMAPTRKRNCILTCARSTAPSVVGRSAIPSLRVSSLASRPSTRPCAFSLASAAAKAGGKNKQNKVALFTTACQEETHTPLSWNKYSYILHFGDFSLSLYGMNFPWKVSLKFHVWTTEGQWCGFSLTVTLYKSSPDGWFIKERLLLLFKELLLWAQEQH